MAEYAFWEDETDRAHGIYVLAFQLQAPTYASALFVKLASARQKCSAFACYIVIIAERISVRQVQFSAIRTCVSVTLRKMSSDPCEVRACACAQHESRFESSGLPRGHACEHKERHGGRGKRELTHLQVYTELGVGRGAEVCVCEVRAVLAGRPMH